MNNLFLSLIWLVLLVFFVLCLCHMKKEDDINFIYYDSIRNMISTNPYFIERFENPKEESLQCKYSLGGYKGSYDTTQYSPCCGVQPNLTLGFNPGLKPCENRIV